MDTHAFLNSLMAARAELDTVLAQVSDTQMSLPGVCDEWSAKDLLAHMTWFEQEMLGVIEQRALAGSEWWNLPPHERNARIWERNRHRALNEIRAEAQHVYQRFLQAVGTLNEAEWHDATCFRDMPADWVPWQLLAENSFEHYRHHAADIRHWLEGLR